ncbi:MAG: response regulator [Legionellales bacterium]|nr:response regulator [Legionellales bacterium]
MNNKVVIIDDDEKIVCALSLRLRAAGYEVLSALDPIHGLELIIEEKPAIVLLDLTMPNGGGLNVAKELRALPDHLRTPIIIITANKQLEPRFQADELGINDYLEKPFDSKVLLQTISTWIEKSEQ